MIHCSVWGIYRQGLQIIFNNMLTRVQACLRVVGGHCQNLLYHVVSYDFQIIISDHYCTFCEWICRYSEWVMSYTGHYKPFFFLWCCGPTQAVASSFVRFLDHTRHHFTVGRTPLDEWSACRRDFYLTTHNTYKRQHPCPWRYSNSQSQQASGHTPTP
jgi:hypothetical protein